MGKHEEGEMPRCRRSPDQAPALARAVIFLVLVAAVTAQNATKGSGGGTKEAKAAPSFADGFAASLAMIILSELGDKTFFIAAIMAMKHSRYVIFVGALAALALMTVLSAAFGFLLPNLIPRTYTHWASVALFVFFGGKLIKEGLEMEGGKPSEELEEVENELSKQDKKCDQESGNADDEQSISLSSGVLWQSFILTFLAEWGDRSQIATIALAAYKDPYGVTVGGILGHALCTGLAVVGGRMLAASISERTVALAGGVLFLLFAAHGVYSAMLGTGLVGLVS